MAAQASPIRIAVGDVLISDKDMQSDEDVRGLCELWCALLTNNLSESESIEILEREDLSNILREFQISLSSKTASDSLVNKLSAVDFIILNEMKSSETQLTIESRLISAKEGAIEAQFYTTVDADNTREKINDVTTKIKEFTVNYFKTKTKLLIAIADFENKSPLDRNDWIETSIPRRLREAIRTLRGVRILEREEVDLLLKEVRLKTGGYIVEDENFSEQITHNKNTMLITGFFDEYQPLTEQLYLEFSISLFNIDSKIQNTLSFSLQLNEFDKGLKGIENSLIEEIQKASLKNITADLSNSSKEQKEYEAKLNFNKAIRLMGYKDIEEMSSHNLWGIRSYEYFSLSNHPFDYSPMRYANILRAIRYLKISVMLNNNNPSAKELLAVLLADSQINDMELARELAYEVAARYPDSGHERDALLFLFNSVQETEGQRYFDLLMEKYKGSYAAQSAIRNLTLSLPDKVETTSAERIEKAMEIMPIAIQWQTDNHFVEIQMQTWFKLTQQSDEYKKMGNEFVEKMIKDYPLSAVDVCTYWAYQWNYVAKNNDKTILWCQRGLNLLKENQEYDKKFGFEKDYLKFMLGRNLYETKQYDSAAEVLNGCAHLSFRDRAVFFKSVSLFNLGRYKEALEGFESLGKFNVDESAANWADKTRQMLNITEKTSWKNTEPTWIKLDSQLPRQYISALASDSEDIWIGTTHPAATFFGEGHNLVMIEKNPRDLEVAKKEGGLFKYNSKTCQLVAFKLGQGISSLWITDVHIKNECIYVSTYGEGLDIHDKRKKSWSHLSEKDGLSSDYVQCMDSDDTYLWVGTGRYSKGGVSRVDLKTKEVLTFLPRDYPSSVTPPTCYVHKIKVIGNFVWCTLGRNGVRAYNTQKNTWKIYPTDISFYSLETIAVFNQRIWFGAWEGNNFILSCNYDGSDWKSISGKENIPETGIFSMKATDDKLLLGTYGLMTLDINDKLSAYGLRSGFTITDILPFSDQIWIGTHNGIKILRIP